MNAVYTVLLIIGAVFVFVFVLHKIRKLEIKISDSIFWFLFAASLVLLAIFPQIAFFFSQLLEFQSPANFVFLYVIAVLIVREFSSTVELSQLRNKVATLAQESALHDSDHIKANSDEHEDNNT